MLEFMDIFLLVAIVICILILGLCAWKLKPRKRLHKTLCNKAVFDIENTKTLDPNHSLMDSHKIFIAALKTLFPKEKELHAAQLIARVDQQFPNTQNIWKLHKLRNKAAHQPNFEIYPKTAQNARYEFVRALKSLI